MKIINIENGNKVLYEVSGTKITFDDELMLNLEKYQNEDVVRIDICRDTHGNLCNGLAANGAYVAQIVVPAIQYAESDSEDSERYRLGLDMDEVVLKLWNI